MPTRFIELAGEINTNMPHYVVHRIMDALNDRKKSNLPFNASKRYIGSAWFNIPFITLSAITL